MIMASTSTGTDIGFRVVNAAGVFTTLLVITVEDRLSACPPYPARSEYRFPGRLGRLGARQVISQPKERPKDA